MVEMPFRRRMSRRMPMRAPIVSFKHQHSKTVSYVGGNVNDTFVVNIGTVTNTAVSPGSTPLGNKMYSVDVTVSFVNASASTGTDFSWMLVHLRTGQTIAGLFPGISSNWSQIGLAPGKNQVIESRMGVLPTEDGASYQFQKHIKLPKSWHRIRNEDQLIIVWNSDQAGTYSVGARFKTYS